MSKERFQLFTSGTGSKYFEKHWNIKKVCFKLNFIIIDSKKLLMQKFRTKLEATQGDFKLVYKISRIKEILFRIVINYT